MAYQVIVKPSAEKTIRKLDPDTRRKVIRLLEALAEEPRPGGVVKLAGDDNLWRVRIGDYRVVYEIHDKRLVILVVKVGHRKDVYR
ncbi:MAG: type II toxin-antitoxin system RelE family toxin [Phycisphaerales bacterium]